MPVRLFHTVLPIPECCGWQMRLAGNVDLGCVEYECTRCLRRLRVSVSFEEDCRLEVDAGVLAATDATP